MHRRAHLTLSLVFVAACAAAGSGTGGRTHNDAGSTGLDASRDGGGITDAGTGHDATPRDSAITPHDSAPMVDAGCDLSTPVPTTIVGDPPDMLLIVDISGSMCTPLGLGLTGASKLSIMKAALTDTVTTYDARINFGMMLFPSGGGEGCNPGAVSVPIAARNAGPITTRLAGLRDDLFGCALANSGATPTPTSVDAARSYFGTIPVNPVGRYALLATDGLPNCGPPIDGGTADTVEEAITAIGALHTAGVTTYVLGFGSGFGSDPTVLNRMATAGGTAHPFNASSAAELNAALGTIAAEIIPPSCTVELGGPMRDPMLFQVRFDGGALIPRDSSHGRGWDYDAATNTVTFYGSECTAVQSGSVTDVQIDFGCPGPLI